MATINRLSSSSCPSVALPSSRHRVLLLLCARVEHAPCDVRQKLSNDVDPGIGCHRNSEAHSAIACRVVSSRLPPPGEERSCGCAPDLRNRKMLRTILAPGQNTALDGIFHARLQTPRFPGTVVERLSSCKRSSPAIWKHVAERGGRVIVRKSASIPLPALPPLRRRILRLSDSSRRSRQKEMEWTNKIFRVDFQNAPWL